MASISYGSPTVSGNVQVDVTSETSPPKLQPDQTGVWFTDSTRSYVADTPVTLRSTTTDKIFWVTDIIIGNHSAGTAVLFEIDDTTTERVIAFIPQSSTTSLHFTTPIKFDDSIACECVGTGVVVSTTFVGYEAAE